MPYYDYICEKCGKDFEESVPIARREEPTKKPCPVSDCGGEVRMRFAKPFIGDPWHFTGKKPDEGFRDRLKEIKSKHLHNTINVR